MAITSAVVLTRTKKRTRRDELSELGDNSANDFTFTLLQALKQLSEDSLSLRSSATGTLAADTDTITIPTDMIEDNGAIDAISLGRTDDSTNDPLLDPITWDEYISGKIAGWVLRDGIIYVTPKENQQRTYTLYYRKFHVESTTTIEFDTKYQQPLITLCNKMVYEDNELIAEADGQELKYRRELARIPDSAGPPVTRIRQGFRG